MSTWDGETDAERRERHRRAYQALGEPMPEPLPPKRERFDIDSARDEEPRPISLVAEYERLIGMEDFEAKRAAIVNEQPIDIAF